MAVEHEIDALLDRLVGDLEPATPEDSAALEEARTVAAAAAAAGLVPGLAPPAATAGTVPPDDAEAAKVLLHRRPVPLTSPHVAEGLPSWANGMRLARTLGPFTDRVGRRIWFDLFPLVRRQVRLVRSPGGVPFLTLPIEVVLIVLPTGSESGESTYTVPAGSLWFTSPLLDPSAPVNSWTGLRITGGTLRFSGAVSEHDGEIVVPADVAVDLTADPEPQSPDAGTGPGQDARTMTVSVPGSFHLHIGPPGATLTVDAAQTARLRAFGVDTQLAPTGAPVRYDADLRVLVVPLATQATPFQPRSVAATAYGLAGSAPIRTAGWGLPVAVIDAAHLGDAAGPGSLVLWLDEGLLGTWVGQTGPVRLMAAAVEADAHRLAVIARHATRARVKLAPQLPPGQGGRIDLSWRTIFPVIFESQARGVEGVITEAELSAVFDRPVDLRGERLHLIGPRSDVLLVASDSGLQLRVESALDHNPGRAPDRVGFQLLNALLHSTRPDHILLSGAYDGVHLDHAAVLLNYALLALVPTLPDPYAASYGGLDHALDQAVGQLVSVLHWEGAATSFDFRLPPGAVINIGGLCGGPHRPFDFDPDAKDNVGVEALDDALAFEDNQTLILLDVSSNVDQFGVAYAREFRAGESLDIDKLTLTAHGQHITLVTLPAVQWEAVETVQDPDPAPLPTWVGFDNSGVPTVIEVPTATLVPAHPAAAISRLVDNFAQPSPSPARARFTLPFGLVAVANLTGPNPADPRWAAVALNQPKQNDLLGAYQLRIDAHDDSLDRDQTAALAGFTAELPVAQPGNHSVLGHDADNIFNTYVGAAGTRPMVPVTRLDLSGYGESLLSEWHNPFHDTVAVVKAQFDVLVGRTALEVVQVRSVLKPYGVTVVRTITMERRNNAVVTRADSGWRAAGDGVYDFPGTSIVTHPGVVKRITHVVNIRDTGQVITVGGNTGMAAVFFDGDLDLDGAPTDPDGTARLTPVKGQFGFIQITAGALIGPSEYAELIGRAGPLGGPTDTGIHIGGGPQGMHVQRVDVGVTQGSGPEFVMAAWGAPVFPGGGPWSVVQFDNPTAAPTAVAQDKGVPLIRAGAATAPPSPPSPSSPYRFADPVDLAQPANPRRDYALLHAMGTQRALYPRPKIDASDPTRITSTQPGSIADPYTLGSSTGPYYPQGDKTIPFPTADWALHVDGNGQYRLDLPAPFPAGVGRRTMRQAGSVKSDVDYTAAQVTYQVDTAQPVPWRFRLDNVTKLMSSTGLGDLTRLKSNVVAAAGSPTTFEQPNLQLGDSLSVGQTLFKTLADLGIPATLVALMRSLKVDWSLKVSEKIPIVDRDGDPLQIPPKPAEATIKFDDTGIACDVDVEPTSDAASFQVGGRPMINLGTCYVVIIVKFEIDVSTENGTVYSLLVGIGVAFEKDYKPFSTKGLFALTFVGLHGDTVLGFGIGFLLSFEAALEPIVSLQLSIEGQLAQIIACHSTDHETVFWAGKLTIAAEVTICLCLSIPVELTLTWSRNHLGPGEPACPLPDVLPTAG